MVSLPPPTKMFPFGGFPLPSGSATSSEELAAGGPIRASSDLRLHAPTRGVSPLAAPFLGAQAKPSSRRRSVSGLLLGWRLFGVEESVLVLAMGLDSAWCS